MRSYAIPVDASRVLIRSQPATPLEVVPTGAPGEVQVFVAQPSFLPALRHAEVESLRAYFRWDESDSYWRRTLYPALFRTERVDVDVEVGYLVERGETVALAGEPGRRPAAGDDAIFGVNAEPVASGVIREPWSPELVRNRDGRPVQVFRSPVLQTYLARFPGFGADLVWLRLLSGTARPAHADAFQRETELLVELSEIRPGAAATVLHHGMLGLESYNGLYAAVRPPIGVDLAALSRGRRRLWSDDPDVLFTQIGEDLLQTLSAAHNAPEPWCVGVISVHSLLFRPSRGPQGPRLQTVILSAPAAGRPGTTVPASVLGLLGDGGSRYLLAQFEQPYERGAVKDLQSLGFALEEIAATLRASATESLELIRKLKAHAS